MRFSNLPRLLVGAFILLVGASTMAMAMPAAHVVTQHVALLTPAHIGWSLVGLAGIAGTIKTVAADNDSQVIRDTVRLQLNLAVADLYYFLQNGLMSTTIATLPAVARATNTTGVKTTNDTVVKNAGVANAVVATDNFWALTGANLAAGFFRRYLLLVDSAGVATVIASTDAATEAGCTWPSLPASGQAIAGILTIQNVTNPFIPGTTALSAAGVTDTYMDGNDDSVFMSAQVTP